jgi:hypothetical protein
MHSHKQRQLSRAVATALLGSLFLAGNAFGAEALRLLARNANDQVPVALRAPASGKLATAHLDRAPVAVSWALDAAQALDARPQAFTSESREYWIDASEAEMQAGLPLTLSAPGAVIRISPHGGKTRSAIVTSDLQLSVAGRRLDNASALRGLASEDDLRAAGMDAPQGSVALRLSDTVPSGTVRLALPTAQGSYLIHVHEPASKLVLKLGAERDSIVGAEPLRIHASLAGATMQRIGGMISAPDGASQDLAFTRQADGSYLASVKPDFAHAGDPGLWEVHAFAVSSGKLAVPRDARTAFAVSVPVARFDGTVTRNDNVGKREVALRVGVETAIASRYQASAVLYGTGADGKLHPAAIAQSAAWLERGKGNLDLRYDAASLATALGSPWELRDLRLINQADMGVLERRERALVLP